MLLSFLINYALVFTISYPSMADWYFIGETDYDYLFIDDESVTIENEYRTVWGLSEVKRMNPETHARSSRYLKEFNCDKRIERVLSMSAFSERSGGGNVIGTLSIQPWRIIAKGTAAELVYEFVCSKRK